MENLDAQQYRKGLADDLRSLRRQGKDEKKFLALARQTERYAETLEIHAEDRKEKRASVGSGEHIKTPEQWAADIIKAIETDPLIEFATESSGSIVRGASSALLKEAVANTSTGGQMKIDSSGAFGWLPQFLEEEIEQSDYFEASLLVDRGSEDFRKQRGRFFIVRKMKISTPSPYFSPLFSETRRGQTFTLALSGPFYAREAEGIKMPELRAFFRDKKTNAAINPDTLDRVFDALALHFVPDYFKEMQRLAAEYKKKPWRT